MAKDHIFSGFLFVHPSLRGVHLKERNYVCEEEGCGKKFGLKGNLKLHIQHVHECVRSYSCKEEKCGKAFAKKSNLVRHTRGVHLKEKNFICEKEGCGKMFGQKRNLKAHDRNTHQHVKKKGERKRAKTEEKAREKPTEKSDLNPVVMLKRLDEGSIDVWTQKDVGKEQGAIEESGNEEEVDEGIRGSILNRGVKFTSTEEFLSFLEEDRSDPENVFVEVEKVGSASCVAASGTALLNPVVRLKKLDIEAKLGSHCEASQGRKPGTGGELQYSGE